MNRDDTLREIEELKRKLNARRYSSYSEYMTSPEWRTLRARVLSRDNHLCQGCLGAVHGLQVHHRNYHTVYDELAYDLVTLCEDCHRKAHDSDPDLPSWRGDDDIPF